MDGFGSITWWGYSPALDLLSNDCCMSKEKELEIIPSTDNELNIFIVGSGDSRLLLTTIARMYRHPNRRKINFYLMESSLELYARHLLFLHVALEPKCRMGLQDKTELFLELFGNGLVRLQSMEYVRNLATEFIKMVTDFDYLEKVMPFVDISNLKFKERDLLEAIFKLWRNSDPALFDFKKCWDLRLRKYLGERYDAIPNVFDWDFNMKLAEKGAGVIGTRHYNRWRQTGQAFEIREGAYDTVNNTLASGAVFNQGGERTARRGYWGDIIVSPYIAYGIESEETSFFKKSNKMFTKSGEDVAEYNMTAMLYEISNQEKYVAPSSEGGGATISEVDETVEEENNDDSQENQSLMVLEDIKVTFLPLGSVPDMHKKSKFQKLFNIVFFSNSMVHHLSGDVHQTFADDAIVHLETSKFMLELKNEQHEEFNKKITTIAEGAGCKPVEEITLDHSTATFVFSAAKS